MIDLAPLLPLDHPGDCEPASPPGSRARCRHCRLIVALERVAELVDGTPIYGWRHVRGAHSPACGSPKGPGRHQPDLTTVRLPAAAA